MSSLSKRELKSLQDEWYQKLAETGFEDIENTKHEHRPLKTWDSIEFSKPSSMHKIRRDAIEVYYTKAMELLSIYEFKSEVHKKIWELHCKGLSRRKIANQIDCMKHDNIGLIIRTIAKEIV